MQSIRIIWPTPTPCHPAIVTSQVSFDYSYIATIKSVHGEPVVSLSNHEPTSRRQDQNIEIISKVPSPLTGEG